MKIKSLLILLFLSFPLFGQELNTKHETSFVVFPQDTNANFPMLFGGKILAEMDRCAGITTRRLLYSSKVKDAVTVGITDIKFRKSGQVKDLIFISGEVVDLGEKTIKIYVKTERELQGGARELLVDGFFTFCAYDVEQKRGIAHGLKLKENK